MSQTGEMRAAVQTHPVSKGWVACGPKATAVGVNTVQLTTMLVSLWHDPCKKEYNLQKHASVTALRR